MNFSLPADDSRPYCPNTVAQDRFDLKLMKLMQPFLCMCLVLVGICLFVFYIFLGGGGGVLHCQHTCGSPVFVSVPQVKYLQRSNISDS